MKRRESKENALARRPAAARLWGTRLLLTLAAAGLTACGSTPETFDTAGSRDPDVEPIPARAPTRTSARHEAGTLETAAAKTGGERVFFNIAEQGPMDPTRTPAASTVERPEERLALLAGLPEDQLVGELASRYAREWTILSGGIGSPVAEDFDPRLEEAAKRLIVLGLLRPGRAAQEADPLGEALTFAMAAERSAEHRLIAAAYLEGAGRTDEARAVLQDLWPSGPEGTDRKSGPRAQVPFSVEGLAFATGIEGPGVYTPAPASQIAPGNMVLVYGEFRNFRSVHQGEGPEGPSYARAFAASLRLLSSTGAEVDRLDFLPEARGRQLAKDAVENVNFWARYRIPARLEPGEYRLVIEARDVLGGVSASAELEFDL